jgi:heptosyltransferase-2
VLEAVLRLTARVVGSRLQRPLDAGGVQKIIILQLQNVGDSVAFTPALRAIRSRFPNARIDLLCSPISAEFYRKCTHVDNVLLDRWFHSRTRSPKAQWQLIRSLRKERYDLAIADASEISASHGLMAMATGARMRIGFSTQNRGFLYTRPLAIGENENFIDDNLKIAIELGCERSSRSVECYFDDADVKRADSLLAADGDAVGEPLIAIHPISNWQSKTWFPDRWAAVADTLVTRFGASIVFVGTAAERPYIENIRAIMRARSISVAGATNLAELGALLSRCALFLGTDSGPRHIAAGTQRPQVTLMSSQDFRVRWDFRRAHEMILRTDPPCSPCFQSFCSHRQCMAAISASMVVEACQSMLGKGARTNLTKWYDTAEESSVLLTGRFRR